MSGPVEIALGVAGHAEARGHAASEEIKKLQDRLKEFPQDLCTRYTRAAVKKAAHWGQLALELQVARIGKKTGNLRRAVATKMKVYKNNRWGLPVPVAVVGYRRSGTGDSKKVPGGKIQIGNDRAFHSHLVEFGTKRRFPGKSKKAKSVRLSINGFRQTLVMRSKERVDPNQWYVMSSYNSSGPFKTSKNGTQPAYPQAFIAKIDPQVGLGQMPALHPLSRAFHSSRSTMENVLRAQLLAGINKATKAMKKRNGG